MSRISSDNEQEFEQLAAYIGFFATAVWGVQPSSPQHPSHHLGLVPGKITKSQRLAGLRQAARDTAEASQSFSAEQVATVDAACKQHHLITLTEVKARYFKRHRSNKGLNATARKRAAR